MSIKINYLKKADPEISANLVLFSNDKFNINSLKKYLTDKEFDELVNPKKMCNL